MTFFPGFFFVQHKKKCDNHVTTQLLFWSRTNISKMHSHSYFLSIICIGVAAMIHTTAAVSDDALVRAQALECPTANSTENGEFVSIFTIYPVPVFESRHSLTHFLNDIPETPEKFFTNVC